MIIAISTVALLHLHTGYMFWRQFAYYSLCVQLSPSSFLHVLQFFYILSDVKESSIKSIS